tara:strand:- start:3760 stop:7221 length:3462 start_codon:yes stop_codon:yes gene_type:complete
MNFDKPDRLDILPQSGLSVPPNTLTENLTTAFDVSKFNGGSGSNSKAFTMLEVWGPIIDLANENGGDFENPGVYLTGNLTRSSSPRLYEKVSQDIYSWMSQNKNTLPPPLQDITPVEIDRRTKAFVKSKENELAELTRINPGVAPAAARFIGSMGSAFGDPVTQATMPFGGWSKSFWKNLMQSAAVNAGSGAISELDVKDWYDELGLDYGYDDFLKNVAMQTAFGAALPVGVAGIKLTAAQAKKGWDVLSDKGRKPISPEDQALADALDAQQEVIDSNPLETPEDPNVAEFEHQSRLTKAQAAVENNQAPNIPPEPNAPIKGTIPLQDELNALDKKWNANNAKLQAAKAESSEIQDRVADAFDVDPNLTKDSKVIKDLIAENKLIMSRVKELTSIQDGLGEQRLDILEKQEQQLALIDNGADNLDGVLFTLDPEQIEVDAKTFQFKAGGDEFGVTERLQGVTVWDKYKAGMVTVYEYADGRLAIADGHQRLGLAKRIKSQDPAQEVKIIGYKLREADGISPEEARVIAAMKNIAEGTGTSIDAAKVLRVEPGRLSELPPQSELVRQARDMMALNDQAFGAIINEVIPPNYGAIVGRLIDDPGLQDAAIQVLAKSEPSNAFQAESIVRQVREAGAEEVEQISLFGEELVSESFYIERAKVLDRAYKELRKDKAAFETLVRNSDRLEAEGNVLVKDANKRKADTDGQTIALLQTLANRKGPLSDALNQAARTARDTNSYVQATRGFLDAVRGSIESGDFDRISSGDVGRAVDGTPQVNRSEVAKEPDLEGFDEPTGIAAERQADQLMTDMYGADEVVPARTTAEADEVAPVRTAAEVEADLKARQPVETVDDIYALAEQSQSYIAKIGADLEGELGVSFKNPGLKDIDTAREKMRRKAYASSKEMTDISRAGFVINTADDADAIVARLGRDAEILDEGWAFTPEGYFDRKVLVRTPNGIVSEIQIWSPKLLDAKNRTGTKLYERMRASKDPAEIQDLAMQMRELYSNALKAEDQSFRALSGIDSLPKLGSNADINAASSGITRPELKTSGPSTGVQGPPGLRTATASVGEMDIAGRPSQLTNIIDDTSVTDGDITLPLDVKASNLFDDMDLEVPLGERVDPDTGDVLPATMTLRDLKGQMDQEDAMIARLEFCTI